MRISTFIIIFVLFTTEIIQAQSFYGSRTNRDAILTFGTGTTSYFGDLNNPGDRFDSKLNINIGLQGYLSDRLSARGEVTWFQLRGTDTEANDESRVQRNLSFSSNNFELNVVGIFDLLPRGRRFYQRPSVNPYVFAGLGLVFFNPTTELNGQTFKLRDYNTEGVDYSPVTMALPFGLGVKFKAGPFFNIGLEAGYRHTLSDYLDDVSTVYPEASQTGSTELSSRYENMPYSEVVGIQRGDPEDNDGYAIFNLKIEYYLPGDIFGTQSRSRYRAPQRRRR